MSLDALKHTLCESLYHTGLMGLAAALREPRTAAPGDRAFQVLIYHRVGTDGDAFVPAVSAAGFAQQMRCLRAHFHPMALSDLLAAADRRAVPPRAVAVTFDDGYRDVLTHALPVLRRDRIPATVYVATAFMDEGRSMWNDRLGCAIRDTSRERLEDIPGLGRLPLSTPAERRTALRRVLAALKPLPPAERDARTSALVRQLGMRAEAAPAMLRWDDVRALRASGVEIGAHTVHHPILSALPADQAWSEIAESKRAIEAQLQCPALHFAYPNGTARDFDAAIEAQVARAGFASAVSTVFGLNTAATNRYALRRGGPWEEDAAAFSVKLFWYRWRARAPEPRPS